MKVYNTLTKKKEEVKPLDGKTVRIYSCGPTVYDHIHIGNLASFIYADDLVKKLRKEGFEVKHVMNITDVDDKTIKKSQGKYPDLPPKEALKKLTEEYTSIFLEDMNKVGNSVDDMKFVKATENINEMQKLILRLYEAGIAYIENDGIYFSIEKYKKAGKKYGQLLKLTEGNTSKARIDNDEYEKDNVHDFALWKASKESEPSWDFEINGRNMPGRPGWHIECSAMSVKELGQPFDIHTGGVDLIFPHHENEIAQSTASGQEDKLANMFFHNEHLLIEGKKMSKSLNNFVTLKDIEDKGFNPMAFRLMVLQSDPHNQANFSWNILQAAQNRYAKLAGRDQSGELTSEQQDLFNKRESARDSKNWEEADQIREKLEKQGIGVNDTDGGSEWYRL